MLENRHKKPAFFDSLPRQFLPERQIRFNCPAAYTLSTKPERNALVETYILLTCPSILTRTFCKFDFHLRLDLLTAWLTLFPNAVVFPVIAHLAIFPPPCSQST